MTQRFLRSILVSAAIALPLPGLAADQLNVLCASDNDWCELMRNTFQKETGIEVSMVRKSAGEIFAQIRAEASNPKTDIWWAGTGDPHLQAANSGYTEVYKSPQLDQLQPWAQEQARISGYRTVGVYMGLLGVGYNPEVLKAKKLEAPKCWKDLTKPEYVGELGSSRLESALPPLHRHRRSPGNSRHPPDIAVTAVQPAAVDRNLFRPGNGARVGRRGWRAMYRSRCRGSGGERPACCGSSGPWGPVHDDLRDDRYSDDSGSAATLPGRPHHSRGPSGAYTATAQCRQAESRATRIAQPVRGMR
jgi:hypothetical protein